MTPVVAITFSNSEENPLQSLKTESQSIYDSLFPLHAGGAIQLYREDFLDLEGIIQIFNRFQDQIFIFHFGGHGDGGKLELGDKEIPQEKFVALLGGQKNKARLVFLNTSNSALMAESLLKAGVMAVVTSNNVLKDEDATEFSKLFYGALSKGESIKRSFDFARDTLFPPDPPPENANELSRSPIFIDLPNLDCPYTLHVADDAEDVLNWKLPMLTSGIIKKPTLVYHSGSGKYVFGEQEKKLSDTLDKFQDQTGLELYQESHVSLEDIVNSFKRFDNQTFLYHFYGSKEWPVLDCLAQEPGQEIEYLKSQFANIKILVLNTSLSLSQMEALFDWGIGAIFYSWEPYERQDQLNTGQEQSLRFTAKFYEYLHEGDSLQEAYTKAARYIWTLTDLEKPPGIIEFDSKLAASFSLEEGQLNWGLYLNPNIPEILDWTLPKPTTRGFDLDAIEQDATPTGKNYLLTIGVDQYRGEIPKLNNAVKDAKRFQHILLKNYRFAKENVYALFNRKASLSNIIKTFDQLLEKVTPEDNVILYFSGHGIVHKPTNRGYWLPVNAKNGDRSTYLSNSDVLDFMKSLKARHVFSIVDSCFSASLFAQRSLDKSTQRRYSIPSRWLITAGRLEPVSDGSMGDHSPFANCIFSVLEAKNKPVFWGEELWHHVDKNLKWNVRNQLPRGEPLQNVGHQGGQFVFMRKSTDMYDVWESESKDETKQEE